MSRHAFYCVSFCLAGWVRAGWGRAGWGGEGVIFFSENFHLVDMGGKGNCSGLFFLQTRPALCKWHRTVISSWTTTGPKPKGLARNESSLEMQHVAEIPSDGQRSQAQRTVRPPFKVRKQSWWPGVARFAEWRVPRGPAPVLSPPWSTPWLLRPACGTLRSCSSWKLFYTSLQLITNSLKFILWVKWDHGYGVHSTVSSKTLFIRPGAAGKKVLARTQNEWVNVGPLRKGDSAHLLVCYGLQARTRNALHWIQKLLLLLK